MEVDEAGQHELARGIERLGAARRGNLRLEGDDPGVADAGIALAAQALGGIDHLAAANHQVEGVVWSEGSSARLRRLSKAARRGGGTGRLQKRPAR